MRVGDIVVIVQGKGTQTLWAGETALIMRRVKNEEFVAPTNTPPDSRFAQVVKGVWYEVLVNGALKQMRSDYLEPLITRCPQDLKGIEH